MIAVACLDRGAEILWLAFHHQGFTFNTSVTKGACGFGSRPTGLSVCLLVSKLTQKALNFKNHVHQRRHFI